MSIIASGSTILAKNPFRMPSAKKGDRHPAARHRPLLAQRVRKLRIELRLGKQSPNERAVLAPESLSHRAHLQPNGLKVGGGGEEERIGVNPRDKRIHHDRSLIGPSPIDCHAAYPGLCGDRVHTQGSKPFREDEMRRRVQDRLMNLWVPRAANLLSDLRRPTFSWCSSCSMEESLGFLNLS